MKPITFEEWERLFDLRRPTLCDPLEYDEDDRAALTFYDNGAVKDSDGDFIVKCDEVKRRN